MKKSVLLRISGSVQGVLFRVSAKEQADALGVTGWASNLEDGTVEIHAEGEETAVDAFIVWCNQGPPSARVEHVEMESVAPEEEDDFMVME